MLSITPIPALNDNYIWMIKHPEFQEAIIVDPGDHHPVLEVLKKENLHLKAILVTHHHADHTAGIAGILKNYDVPVYASAKAATPECNRPLMNDDYIHFPDLDIYLRTLEIPGHTLDHLAFIGDHSLFCGDTLFTGGCGRIFEGTAKMMWNSLATLARLPGETQVYCAHEYTLANLRFAKVVEPENSLIDQRLTNSIALRERHLPTVPSLMRDELETNPFFRCHIDEVRKSVEQHCGRLLNDHLEVFSELRKWKDSFNQWVTF